MMETSPEMPKSMHWRTYIGYAAITTKLSAVTPAQPDRRGNRLGSESLNIG
jgi:hypothetical protein